MFSRFTKLSLRYSSAFAISRNNNMNWEKCYFMHDQKENKIEVTFLFKLDNTVRQFNLIRNPAEPLETLFSRIEANIIKVTNKSKKKKVVTEESKNMEAVIKIFDAEDNEIPHSKACSELFEMNGPLKLSINDQIYQVLFNAPCVKKINLPKIILAGFPVYPENIEAHYTNFEMSIFRWYKGVALNNKGKEISDIHINWEFITEAPVYTPEPKDVGSKLKLECLPVSDGILGAAVEVISKAVIEAGPGPCPFEKRHLFTSTKLNGASFRCVSYNILADLYCDSDFSRTELHPYCPPYALQIDYRKQLFLRELIGYNADIMCLQEVDSKIYYNCLKPILNKNGFKGHFYKKGKEVAEGLACFYSTTRYRCLGNDKIILAKALPSESYLKPIWNVVETNTPLKVRLLDLSTAASATILQSIHNPNEVLVVGNTHLYFHPDADHIRLIQGGIVIYWLQQIINKMQNNKTRVSLILCGDFNSVPSCGIFQLYTQGEVPSSLPDWSSNANEAISNLSLKQHIPLGSACGTPEYTNFTSGFADCLDYIFYDTRNLVIEQVIPFPSTEELTAHTALPSIVFPSDHIAVVSDLRYK